MERRAPSPALAALEERVVELVGAAGPLTGAELRERCGAPSLALWQTCRSSSTLALRTIGHRYLRLDLQVEGYARLSPSILREFFTYSVTGLAAATDVLEQRAAQVAARSSEISQAKHELARHFVAEIHDELEAGWPADGVCFILAGDIVYSMAHRVPRPERSTGRMVRGSDIDLVVVVADELPDDFVTRLDEAIHHKKYRTLISPSLREEIDYIVKRMARVHEQLRFDSFKRMLACKILHEGVLLQGSQAMFDGIKALLREQGVAQRLETLEARALAERQLAEQHLLAADPDKIAREERLLFYSSEESEEFD